jgi:hypothetical protein
MKGSQDNRPSQDTRDTPKILEGSQNGPVSRYSKYFQIMKWNEDRPFSRYLRYPKSLEGSPDRLSSRYTRSTPKSWKVLNICPYQGTPNLGRFSS